MDALRVETLLEVGNIIMSAVMSAMSILLTSRLSFQFPSYRTERRYIINSDIMKRYEIGIIARTRFEVHQKVIEGIFSSF